jgi:hypothetical protein
LRVVLLWLCAYTASAMFAFTIYHSVEADDKHTAGLDHNGETSFLALRRDITTAPFTQLRSLEGRSQLDHLHSCSLEPWSLLEIDQLEVWTS